MGKGISCCRLNFLLLRYMKTEELSFNRLEMSLPLTMQSTMAPVSPV